MTLVKWAANGKWLYKIWHENYHNISPQKALGYFSAASSQSPTALWI